ncbi:MAG TPA: RHS repeat-associated core domain-containing protein, partial [Acidobacteriaceae bacterium]|nr:RHS repeat-associated core domain-containing protein [Acidobacteriaceae bacterium]
MDANSNLLHFNVFLEGKLLATFTGSDYLASNWHYALNDWVGTKRVVANSDGSISSSFWSGPFGDLQSQNGSGADPSEQHFTGKERDLETGNDYFGARYYTSTMGRFYGPDGARLEKGNIASFSCDWRTNGFTATRYYGLGPNGEQLEEMDANSNL